MGESVSSRSSGIFDTEVISNASLCAEHYRFTVRVADFPAASPGQFIQIRCGRPARLMGWPGDGDYVREPIIRRPFSMADVRRVDELVEIDILHRVIGPGTAWMAELAVGDAVNILGPLGKPFHVDEEADLHIVVGGGTGLPPIMWLGSMLARESRRCIGVCGARHRDLLPMDITEIDEHGQAWVSEFGNAPVMVTTDDGSLGTRGNVLAGIDAAVARYNGAKRIGVYACGPEGMLAAVARLAMERGYACQVCLERMMACGMGTCQSCVVPIDDASDGGGWRYALCCTDGPVFDARRVRW